MPSQNEGSGATGWDAILGSSTPPESFAPLAGEARALMTDMERTEHEKNISEQLNRGEYPVQKMNYPQKVPDDPLFTQKKDAFAYAVAALQTPPLSTKEAEQLELTPISDFIHAGNSIWQRIHYWPDPSERQRMGAGISLQDKKKLEHWKPAAEGDTRLFQAKQNGVIVGWFSYHSDGDPKKIEDRTGGIFVAPGDKNPGIGVTFRRLEKLEGHDADLRKRVIFALPPSVNPVDIQAIDLPQMASFLEKGGLVRISLNNEKYEWVYLPPEWKR